MVVFLDGDHAIEELPDPQALQAVEGALMQSAQLFYEDPVSDRGTQQQSLLRSAS